MLEEKNKIIDGIEFVYRPLFATPARKLLDELIQRFGPALAAGVEGVGAAGEMGSLNIDSKPNEILGALGDSLGGVIRVICNGLDPDFHERIVELLGKQSDHKNASGNMETLIKTSREVFFATRLLTEAKWIGFCLESQYADFFGLVRTATAYTLAAQAQKTELSSKSQKG